jgi:catechol 2,3-dioxygenase-like lactoylglutathione lyase family enzyme
MGILAFNHFNISVADLGASIRFYQDVLGLRLTGRGRVQYPHLDQIVGYSGTDIEWAELEVPAGGLVELFRYHYPQGGPVDPVVINSGTTHLAFTVEDIDTMVGRLHACGASTGSPIPVTIPFGDWKGWRSIYVKDPDGVTIELSEPP